MLPVCKTNVLPAAKHLRKLRLAKLHCNSFCQITTMWKYYLVHGTCYLSIQLFSNGNGIHVMIGKLFQREFYGTGLNIGPQI